MTGFYVVLTSNIGSAEAMRMQSAPFASLERTVLMRVGQQLRPELVGRITEKLVFNRLDFETQRAICEAMVLAEMTRLAAFEHEIGIGQDAIEFLVRRGYHRMLGARPMRGAVERFLQDAIATDLLIGGDGCGLFSVDTERDCLVLRKTMTQCAGR